MEEVDGDFGCAMYDMLDSMTYIGRDRLGIRSLYYAIDANGSLFVASEMKGIPTSMTNVKAL